MLPIRTKRDKANTVISPSWMAIGFLLVFATAYCFSALTAPFWDDNDTWSNLLPVIHYRQSILYEHSLPLHTNLWYGGRAQWENPLWNFLYLPGTIFWLTLPLDWGTRIVFFAHFIFALLAARLLASLMLKSEIERVCAAIILCSPIYLALTAGHIEKIMSWGWILLSLYFLLNLKLTPQQRGIGSGICLGIAPLTGANYYSLYAIILLMPLVISYKDRKLALCFAAGASLGLLHLPSVWYLIGQSRAHAKFFREVNSMGVADILLSLSIGISRKTSWETWAPVGVSTLYIAMQIFIKRIRSFRASHEFKISAQNISLLLSIFIFVFLATGIAYQGHGLLDMFRVASRAMAFIALAVVLFILINIQLVRSETSTRNPVQFLLLLASVQIIGSVWQYRPLGSVHSPYDPAVQTLANILREDGAKSVWFSESDLRYMYIHVGLNRNNLALPVVYYGDMGQSIQIAGNHCGYSFDHLIARLPVEGSTIALYSNVEWSAAAGEIAGDHLSLLRQWHSGDDAFNVYRVICD